MKPYIVFLILVSFVLLISACTSDNPNDPEITIYKTPTCGCCVGWSSYMKEHGFNVKTVMLEDLSTIKAKHNIPDNMKSCHTAEINGYFVEGHIPVEVVNQMLEEKPDIDGIALPRMPSGSPGMPGPKIGPWTIYALKDGKISEYTIV